MPFLRHSTWRRRQSAALRQSAARSEAMRCRCENRATDGGIVIKGPRYTSFFQSKSSSTLAALVLLALVSVPAIASSRTSSRTETESRPTSLRLIPSEAVLRGAKASQRFVVLAKDKDGFERDVTSIASFRF